MYSEDIKRIILEKEYEGIPHRFPRTGWEAHCVLEKRLEEIIDEEEDRRLLNNCYGLEWVKKIFILTKDKKFKRVKSVREGLKEGALAVVIYYHEYDARFIPRIYEKRVLNYVIKP